MNNNSAEMIFDGVSYRDSESIALHQGNYFKNLYTDVPTPNFDLKFTQEVALFVNNIKTE